MIGEINNKILHTYRVPLNTTMVVSGNTLDMSPVCHRAKRYRQAE